MYELRKSALRDFVETSSTCNTCVVDERDGKTPALTGVNDGIVVIACECGHEDCHEHVLLTYTAHCTIRACGVSVLARGHVRRTERADAFTTLLR